MYSFGTKAQPINPLPLPTSVRCETFVDYLVSVFFEITQFGLHHSGVSTSEAYRILNLFGLESWNHIYRNDTPPNSDVRPEVMLRNQLGKDLKRMKNYHNQSFQHYSRSVRLQKREVSTDFRHVDSTTESVPRGIPQVL